MDRLSHHFATMAYNNAWANHRMLKTVGTLERSLRGEPVNQDARQYFDPEEPFAEQAPLAEALRAADFVELGWSEKDIWR